MKKKWENERPILILLSTDVTNVLAKKIAGNYQNHILVISEQYFWLAIHMWMLKGMLSEL